MLDKLGAYAMRFAFKGAYAPLKLLPMKRNKAVILSRQSSEPSVDVRMLSEEILRQNPDAEVVTLVHRDDGGVKGSISMMRTYLRSLYHMATSKVCILESYWPPVSVCNHRKDMKVVQMWHSIGKVKQSGLITAGKPGGRSSTVSRIMQMHQGYDYIIAGGSAWNRFYCESFDCDESVLRNVGLPRIDHLVNDREQIAEGVYGEYPELRGSKVVLYAPTFRRGGRDVSSGLLRALADADCKVVVKAHPNQSIDVGGESVMTCPDIPAIDLLCVADYLVTDYSAIAVEAAALGVKTLYYVPDYDQYKEGTGLNIDIYKEMPGCVFEDPEEVRCALERAYPQESMDAYREKFLYPGIGSSTKAIADIVFDEAGLER